MPSNEGNIILYQTGDGKVTVNVEDELERGATLSKKEIVQIEGDWVSTHPDSHPVSHPDRRRAREIFSYS
ncbi:MAG: hypothetical protein LBK56_08785 [Gracilibacteraceae bacterium]|jgi:hypothetical protein|nr:hypothetical protein [Gracilibacteraceae bacterium]